MLFFSLNTKENTCFNKHEVRLQAMSMDCKKRKALNLNNMNKSPMQQLIGPRILTTRPRLMKIFPGIHFVRAVTRALICYSILFMGIVKSRHVWILRSTPDCVIRQGLPSECTNVCTLRNTCIYLSHAFT